MSERAEKERAEFEKIWLEVHPDDCAPDQAFIRRNGDPNGTYAHDDVEECWQIWRAARTTPDHRDERIAELEREIRHACNKILNAMEVIQEPLNTTLKIEKAFGAILANVEVLAALSNSLPTEEDKSQ
jgi:hypothetical protein